MKNSTTNNDFHNISSNSERDTLDDNQKKTNFSSKAVKTMPEQLITPPARVWDKIQAILDEQDKDNRRKSGENLLNSSLGINEIKRKRLYLATVAGLSLVAGLVWIVR
ncbi:MAG TPA: hypothetical protein VF540_12895 [Segetibacter sp.]